jgi:hypothetical protein
MTEQKKFLALLQVAVPSDTTVAAEIKILEILGIVSNPELVSSMDLAISFVPANTPATLYGLIKLLGNLIKKHPKSTKHHHDALNKVLKDFTGVPDGTLNFGIFLPICEALMKAIPFKPGKAAEEKLV